VVFSARKFGIFTIRSTMAVTEGEIRVGSRLEDSSARVTLDATSFTTPVRKRDEHVKGPRLLDVVRHPEIAFRSTELAMVDGKWIVGGVLVCHGAERRVDLDVDSLVPSGDTLVNRAASTLDRREFGVRAMKLVASSLLRIEVEVVAVRATNP
jgi:polyisoprenoid-binding protein YceI